MNLTTGMKRLFVVLAVPGILLLGYGWYVDSRDECQFRLKRVFSELVWKAAEEFPDRAAAIDQSFGRTTMDMTIDQKAAVLISTKSLPEEQVRAMQRRVSEQQDRVCAGAKTKSLRDMAIIGLWGVGLFWGLFFLLKVGAWVGAGFRGR